MDKIFENYLAACIEKSEWRRCNDIIAQCENVVSPVFVFVPSIHRKLMEEWIDSGEKRSVGWYNAVEAIILDADGSVMLYVGSEGNKKA